MRSPSSVMRMAKNATPRPIPVIATQRPLSRVRPIRESARTPKPSAIDAAISVAHPPTTGHSMTPTAAVTTEATAIWLTRGLGCGAGDPPSCGPDGVVTTHPFLCDGPLGRVSAAEVDVDHFAPLRCERL